MAVDPQDYEEPVEETEYTRHKKMMNLVFYEIKNLEQRITDIMVDFKDSHRAHAAGLKNVYDKFTELENRQKAIEELLNSDHLKDMLKLIPNEETVLKMFDAIDSHPISTIKERIDEIREDLEDLVDKFTL